MSKKKNTILEVTFTVQYIIPMIDDERTKINGWTIDLVIEDWFKNHPLDQHHVTRDGHRIGNSKKLIDIDQYTIGEFFGT